MKKTITFRDTAPGIVQVSSESGHRRGYRDLFSGMLGLTPETGPLRGAGRFARMVSAPYVLIATMECDYLGALSLMVVRSLLGRPSSGLLLRPQTCFLPGWRFAAKRIVLRVAKRLPRQKILSIVPFSIRPEFARIATDWIHDPELWDLSARGLKAMPETDLSQKVAAQAAGRPILAVLGAVSGLKGFARLHRMLLQTPNFAEQIHVIIAGRISSEMRELAKELSCLGAHVEDRSLSDDELLSLYGVASIAWCCYDPEYDQASGIFGRAVQTSVMPILRYGSILEAQARELGVSYVALGEMTVAELIKNLPMHEVKSIRQLVPQNDLKEKLGIP